MNNQISTCNHEQRENSDSELPLKAVQIFIFEDIPLGSYRPLEMQASVSVSVKAAFCVVVLS